MLNPCETCPQREVHAVEYRLLESKLKDVKERVEKLETTMARGILLLVANLVGVVMTLAQEFLQR